MLSLAGAAACAGAAALTWAASFRTDIGRSIDAHALAGFIGLEDTLGAPADFFVSLVYPPGFAVLATAILLTAVVRARGRLALMALVVLVGADLTTLILKPLLAEARPTTVLAPGEVDAEAWPSGHATAALALALGFVIVVPPRVRPVAAAVGALFAIAVANSVLILSWHFPSDVAGGFLVAAGWALIAVAAVPPCDAVVVAHGDPGTLGPTVASGILVALTAVAVALTRPAAALSYVEEHAAFAIVAPAIAVAGLALTALFVPLLRA